MARPLKHILADLPAARRSRVEARYQKLKQEVESLVDLRRIAGKVQADIAAALEIKQPSVSKIEKQADMYLSTLRSYVEAIGGELQLTVKLPGRSPLQIRCLGEDSARSDPLSKQADRPSRRRGVTRVVPRK
jgi:hypothetical protein